MSTFKKPSLFKEEMVTRLVILAGFSRKKPSNRMAAKWFNVRESTIRNWRKEHEDFDYAFGNAEAIWMERISKNIWGNLEPREKVTVIKDSKGKAKTIKEQILPTHNDIAAALKGGCRKPLVGFEEQERIEILAAINKSIRSGVLSYIDAVCECELEGIDVPESWKRREYGRLLRLYDEKEISIRQLIRELRIAGLKVEPELQAEIAKELNLPPPVPDLPPMRELFDD